VGDHQLITRQLEILADRLPGAAVEELADGLRETYDAHLARAGDPGAAARDAIAEFGDADTITAAYVRYSPWRRAARALLLTGPSVGALWAFTLLSQQAWDWPLPVAGRLLFGGALVAVVVALVASARATHAYRRARAATLAGAAALVALDGCLVATAMTLGLAATPPLALAVAVSGVRVLATAGMMPRLIRH